MLYIPSQEQRIKIYTKIKQVQQQNSTYSNQLSRANQAQYQIQSNNTEKGNDKKLTKQQVINLVTRLSKDTKKEFVIKDQIQKLGKINLEKRKIVENAQKVQQRLIKAGKDLETKKQKLREEELRRQQATMQPIPKITDKAKAIIGKPFIQRIDQIANSKQDQLRKLTEKYDPHFKSQLNPYSLFMAEVQNSKDFLKRVEKYNQTKKEIAAERVKAKEQQEMQGVTFNPKLNEKSIKIASTRNRSSSNKKNMQNKIQQESKNSFKPEINKKSEELVRARKYSTIEFSQRLYDDMRKISLKKFEKRQQMQAKNTFKPKINEKSLKILRNRAKEPSLEWNQDKLSNSSQEYEEIPFDRQKLFPCETPVADKHKEDNEFLYIYNEIKYSNENKQNINSMNITNHIKKSKQSQIKNIIENKLKLSSNSNHYNKINIFH